MRPSLISAMLFPLILTSALLAAPFRKVEDSGVFQLASMLVKPNSCSLKTNRGILACTDKLAREMGAGVDLEVKNIADVEAEEVPPFIMNSNPEVRVLLTQSFIDMHSVGICGATAEECMHSLETYSFESIKAQPSSHQLMSREMSPMNKIVIVALALIGVPGIITASLVYAVSRSASGAVLIGMTVSGYILYSLNSYDRPSRPPRHK